MTDSPVTVSKPALETPCVGICSIDTATGWCYGCGRSRDDIARWRKASAAAQADILARLPERRQKLGVAAAPLPLAIDGMIDLLARLARQPDVTWVMGMSGGIAEYCRLVDDDLIFRPLDRGFAAMTDKGALRITMPDLARLFHIESGDGGRFCLALPPHAPFFEDAAAIREIGPDAGAIREEDRGGVAFDLGLDHWSVRFMVRSAHPAVIDAMRAQAGASLFAALPAILPPLLAHPAHRIAQTVLGRIEVFAPIAAPGGVSPVGPHTHILPHILKEKRGLALGEFLPRTYRACASIFAGKGIDLKGIDIKGADL